MWFVLCGLVECGIAGGEVVSSVGTIKERNYDTVDRTIGDKYKNVPLADSEIPTVAPTLSPTFPPTISPTSPTTVPTARPTTSPTTSTESNDDKKHGTKRARMIFFIVVGVVGLVVLGIFSYYAYKHNWCRQVCYGTTCTTVSNRFCPCCGKRNGYQRSDRNQFWQNFYEENSQYTNDEEIYNDLNVI
jgi:hypothetical protein